MLLNFEWSDIPNNISRACFVLTVFCNTSLIYLTVFHTKQIVGTYRNIIITFAIIGMSFSTMDILVRPLFHSYNGCFIYFTLGSSFRSSKRASEAALLAYSSSYAIIIAFLAVQFIYRACVLSRPKWARKFRGSRLFYWILYAFLIGFVWALVSMFCYPDENAYNYVRHEVMNFYQVEIRDVPCYLLLAYNEDVETGEQWIRWNTVTTVGSVSMILATQYGVMMFCGVAIYRRTKWEIDMSSTYHEQLQKQVFQVLIYQVTAPSLFFHLPGIVVLLAPFFDFKVSFHSRIIVYVFSVYPLVDTLILLNVISEYKRAYKRFLKWLWNELYQFLGGDTPRPIPSSTSLGTVALAQI